MTDLDAAAEAAAAAASEWDLAPPVLLRRGMNALFGCGPVVVRVGNATAPAELSHRLVHQLIAQGIPSVRPVPGLAGTFERRTVTAWERLDPDAAVVDWEAVGAAVRRLHSLPLDVVPAGYPTPDPTGFPWWDFEGLLRELGDDIDTEARAGLEAAVTAHLPALDAVQRDIVLCHGDVHPGNVLVAAGEPVLIDWDLLCLANPAWDHAMLTTFTERWGGPPGTYEAFASGYGRSLADEWVTRSIAALRNVAATLMRIRAGLDQPSARAEAERRLRYWRGDPDAPVWRAQ